jgi:hypothetical protein
MVLGFGKIKAFWRKFSAPVDGFKREWPAVVITAGHLLKNSKIGGSVLGD